MYSITFTCKDSYTLYLFYWKYVIYQSRQQFVDTLILSDSDINTLLLLSDSDFACRNCLVMSDLSVKVGDYGVAEDQYRVCIKTLKKYYKVYNLCSYFVHPPQKIFRINFFIDLCKTYMYISPLRKNTF